MKLELRSTWLRYSLAVGAFAVTLGIAALLSYLLIKLSLTAVIVAALVITAWFGGRGPGMVFIALLILATVLMTPIPIGTSIGQAVFSYISAALLLIFLLLLISGRKEHERKLSEQSELLRVTLSSIGDAVIATDIDGNINFLNPTAENITGWTHTEASGKPLEEVFHIVNEDTREPVENPFPKIKRDGLVVGLANHTVLIGKNGSETPIDDSGAPIKDSNGDVIGSIIVFHDVTERKQAEQALIKSEERLLQSQKMEAIGTLTGGVAHDFNNLLTAILGNTQLALRKIPAGDAMQMPLLEIEKACDRATLLTRQLLAFSRRQHLDRRNIDLNDTVREILNLLERIIGEHIKIETDFFDGFTSAFADRAQLEQVIMNLSVNARDAMPQGGTLTIKTSNLELDEYYCRQYPDVQPGNYVQISVGDTGCGMDEKTQARIFEPFFTTKAVHKGTGLGLSMAYGIVKQHGGHINIYSELGRGTTFKVFLPAVRSEAEKEVKAPQLSVLGGMETLLVAEDEPALRNLSRDVLEALGYTVLMATNGTEAVEMYIENRNRIDALIFDVVMPSMGGAEAYERICEMNGDVPVIFMTGYGSETVYNQQGGDGKNRSAETMVIQKPYSLDTLGSAVRDVLDKTRRASDLE